MLIKNIILSVIGLSGGLVVAAGVFAFITMIGVIPRMASRTKTAQHLLVYEDAVILGGILGNWIYMFHWHIRAGWIGLIMYGLFSGMYVGGFAMALAEMLNVFPIFMRKIKLVYGVPFVVLSVALGKCVGSMYQLFQEIYKMK